MHAWLNQMCQAFKVDTKQRGCLARQLQQFQPEDIMLKANDMSSTRRTGSHLPMMCLTGYYMTTFVKQVASRSGFHMQVTETLRPVQDGEEQKLDQALEQIRQEIREVSHSNSYRCLLPFPPSASPCFVNFPVQKLVKLRSCELDLSWDGVA